MKGKISDWHMAKFIALILFFPVFVAVFLTRDIAVAVYEVVCEWATELRDMPRLISKIWRDM